MEYLPMVMFVSLDKLPKNDCAVLLPSLVYFPYTKYDSVVSLEQ